MACAVCTYAMHLLCLLVYSAMYLLHIASCVFCLCSKLRNGVARDVRSAQRDRCSRCATPSPSQQTAIATAAAK